MRTTAFLLALAACGGDDGAITYDCLELSMTVSQRHGTCVLEMDPDTFDGCPLAEWAWCGTPTACPSGWNRSCEVTPGGAEINCTYGIGTTCSSVSELSVSFPYVQTLDGIDGLSVYLSEGRCEFRPCKPL
jgi:hypothetical protein